MLRIKNTAAYYSRQFQESIRCFTADSLMRNRTFYFGGNFKRQATSFPGSALYKYTGNGGKRRHIVQSKSRGLKNSQMPIANLSPC